MAQKIAEVHPPESLALLLEAYKEDLAMETSGQGDPKRIRKLELEYICKDDSTVWTESNFSFVRNPDGSPEERNEYVSVDVFDVHHFSLKE